ncbi:MAG: DUF4147 domain-containing protein [Anaerolineae bacterium]|nr:DUF4147 domain-containing protein [Anaerolineae bacterium]
MFLLDPQAMHTQTMSLINDVLTAVHPAHLIPQFMQRHGRQLTIGPVQYDLDHGRLFLVSVGKAAVPMTQAAAEILGDSLFAGVGITKSMGNGQLSIGNFQLTIGEHPVSGQNSVRATTAVTNLLRETRPGDLLLCLLSGGASAC